MTDTTTLNKRNAHVQGFLGTFAADRLPDLSRLPFVPGGYSLIANYSPHTGLGTHWVAFAHLRSHGLPSLFFDSYGELPDNDSRLLKVPKTHFAEYLRKNSATGKFQSNVFDLQAIHDFVTPSTCGEFASFFIHAGCLPKKSAVHTRSFLKPWNRFKPARVLPVVTSQPQLRLLARSAADEAVARNNDAEVMRWWRVNTP